MGKSDPYLEFSRQMPDGKFVAVHRTEVFDFVYFSVLLSDVAFYVQDVINRSGVFENTRFIV